MPFCFHTFSTKISLPGSITVFLREHHIEKDREREREFRIFDTRLFARIVFWKLEKLAENISPLLYLLLFLHLYTRTQART